MIILETESWKLWGGIGWDIFILIVLISTTISYALKVKRSEPSDVGLSKTKNVFRIFLGLTVLQFINLLMHAFRAYQN
jgi:hypothetical protein